MRVLWVVGFVVPQASRMVGMPGTVFGGWVGAMIEQLKNVPDLELGVAMRAPVKMRIDERIDGIHYYALPQCGALHHDIAESDCRFALESFRPDLLHVEGTESAHAHTFLRCWSGPNVVELQGLVSGHERYYQGGLSLSRMISSLNPAQMLTAVALALRRKKNLSQKRISHEIATIGFANNIIGRTTWDRAHSYAINKKANYTRCNHSLRDAFYRSSWSIENMRRHSLFIGNAQAPLKGAHFAMQAVSLLRDEFPDIKLCVAGESPYPSSWKQKEKWVGYAAYLRRLVDKLNIRDQIVFTGCLQAEIMAVRMAISHVFVLCSTIENSPTTLSEAMLMGVPSVTAYVGGISDMACDGIEALYYRDNDPVHLAFQIKRIFDDDALAQRLSGAARSRALADHDPQKNLNCMLSTYRSILSGEDKGM